MDYCSRLGLIRGVKRISRGPIATGDDELASAWDRRRLFLQCVWKTVPSRCTLLQFVRRCATVGYMNETRGKADPSTSRPALHHLASND